MIVRNLRLLAQAKLRMKNYKRSCDLKPLEAKISCDFIGRFKSRDLLQFCISDFGSSKQPEKHGIALQFALAVALAHQWLIAL